MRMPLTGLHRRDIADIDRVLFVLGRHIRLREVTISTWSQSSLCSPG